MVCHVSCREGSIIKGPWTREEDLKLILYMHTHGEGSWPDVPRKAGLRRCSKSCRLRWRNYLRPDVKRGHFSEAEKEIILKLQALVGNKWSLIARRLPGRTDNEIKNFWNTHVKKKFRRLGIDPGIHRIIGSASVPFKPTGLIIPPATGPIVKPLEDPSASRQMRPICYSVQNGVQISSEDQIISELNQDWKDVQSHIQAVAGDPTQEKTRQTDVDQWRQGEYSGSSTLSGNCLTDPTEQISYCNSVHSNSGTSCYSSELWQNCTQKVNAQTNADSEFMGWSGIPLPDTLTEDSDSNEIKSMQEFSDQLFSPWSGLISPSFINNYFQSMDVLGDGGDHFGGFNPLWT